MDRGRIAVKKRFIFIAFTLVLIDQTIKVIIANTFMEPHVHVDWIEGVLAFCPTQNIHLSWIPSMFSYLIGLFLT